MRLALSSLALALSFALSSPSLSASAAGGGVVYDLHDIGPGSGAGIVFVDALQQASGWNSTTAVPLRLDRTGNVRSLAPGQAASRTVYLNESYPAGDYTLLYDGSGTFDANGGSIVANAPGRATLRVGPNDGSGLSLRLLATDPSNPVRNVRLILPGFEATYQSQPFAPGFVRSLSGRTVLRFAQWMHADTYVDSNFWTDRPRVGRPTQVTPSGVAPEYMILLANLTGASPWFNLPVGATDGYVYGYASLVHATLDPRIHAIFQYGNEVWNPATPGNAYARMAARNTGIAGEPASAALTWYAHRSARVFALVQAAYGRDAARAISVISGPVPNQRAASVLDASLIRALGTPPQAFAVPVASQSDLVAVTKLNLLPNAHAFGYALEPGAQTAAPLVANAAPLANAKAQLILGGDIPAENEVHTRPSLAPGRVGAPLDAPAELDLGGRPGVTGALGLPMSSIDVAREGNLDWAELQGTSVTQRKALAKAPIAIAASQGGAFGFSAPADTTERILRLYVSANRTPGVLTATLGGATYTDNSLGLSNGARSGVYTLVYRASGPGQKLDVRFAPQSAGGSVTVQAVSLISPAPGPNTAPPSDEPQYHNDLTRTGWNPSETILTPANVATSAFHKLSTLSVDGDVLAQPLYIAGYTIGGASHNVLIVATENDTVYEFDADSGALLNHVSLGPSQSSNDVGCQDVEPVYGITATPVIVRSTGTIYVVAASEPTSGTFKTTLHALDIATLSDKVTPTVVSASVTLTNGSTLSFDPHNQYNRPGLVWANNALYLSAGSHCDNASNSIGGWLLRYNSSLVQTAKFSTIADPSGDCSGASLASIWMSGFAPSLDASGNLYVATGNGQFDANTGGRDYGESVLKLSPDLSTVLSSFTPHNYNSLNCGDGDLGSGGVMVLPRPAGLAPGPQAVVAMGKGSTLYLLSTTSLGGLTSADTGAIQVINDSGGGVWGGPAFYGGPTGSFVYYQTDGDTLHAYRVAYTGVGRPVANAGTRSVVPAPVSLTLSSSGTSGAGYGGSIPVVSSNGQLPHSGIVWLVNRSGSTLTLEAYDALNVHTLLFSGAAGPWPNPEGNGFVTPLVANGKVYVPSANAISVFGL